MGLLREASEAVNGCPPFTASSLAVYRLARFVNHPLVEHREWRTVGVSGQQAQQMVVRHGNFANEDAELMDLEVTVGNEGILHFALRIGKILYFCHE